MMYGGKGNKSFACEGLALDTISRTERKSRFPMSLTSSSSSRDRKKYMVEYGSCCKQREVLVDKSHHNSRESIS